MDTSIRKLSLAESAQHAAQLAAETLVHAENPHESGSVEHREWEAAYCRAFHAIVNPSQESSA